jgi:hypothetical protein
MRNNFIFSSKNPRFAVNIPQIRACGLAIMDLNRRSLSDCQRTSERLVRRREASAA